LIRDVGSFTASEPEGDIEVAWQWNTGYHEGLHTFANGISTTEGGMHAEGFKRALTNTINRYAKDRGLLKADSSRGVWELSDAGREAQEDKDREAAAEKAGAHA